MMYVGAIVFVPDKGYTLVQYQYPFIQKMNPKFFVQYFKLFQQKSVLQTLKYLCIGTSATC
jgi:hypothetical protein